MTSFFQSYSTVIFSSLFSVIGVVTGIFVKYILDILLESQRLKNQRKQLIHTKQLDAACKISSTLNIMIKDAYGLIVCTNRNEFQEKYDKFVTSVHSFDKTLNNEILLINAKIFNTALEITGELTKFSSGIKKYIECHKELESTIIETFSIEHGKIYEKKIKFDEVLREFSSITN